MAKIGVGKCLRINFKCIGFQNRVKTFLLTDSLKKRTKSNENERKLPFVWASKIAPTSKTNHRIFMAASDTSPHTVWIMMVKCTWNIINFSLNRRVI